jgi:hypothetical protein
MPDADPLEEKILKRIPLEILVVAAAGGAVSALLMRPETGAFVFAGGALSALGFLWLKASLTRFLEKKRGAALKSGLLLYLARLLLICLAFLIIILLFPRRIIAFAAGFSAVVVVFFGEAVSALRYLKQWKS